MGHAVRQDGEEQGSVGTQGPHLGQSGVSEKGAGHGLQGSNGAKSVGGIVPVESAL